MGYILDWANGITGVCVCPTHQIVHIQYGQVFADLLYLSKAEKHGVSPVDYRKQNGNYEKDRHLYFFLQQTFIPQLGD